MHRPLVYPIAEIKVTLTGLCRGWVGTWERNKGRKDTKTRRKEMGMEDGRREERNKDERSKL